MHHILKERVWRKLEALPQEQVYQVLDYIEFLEAKYARDKATRPDALQRFAERVEDSLRMRSVAPKVISGTVGLLGTAQRVMRTVSDAGREILGDGTAAGPKPAAAGSAAAPGSAAGSGSTVRDGTRAALPAPPNGGDPGTRTATDAEDDTK
jgi:hypothetical protein